MARVTNTYWELVEPYWKVVDIYRGGDAFLRTFGLVPHAPGILLAAHWCQSEVRNGGFHQFFTNPTGVLAPEALEAFATINRPELGELLRTAMAFFGEVYLRERPARLAAFDGLARGPRKTWDPFSTLDKSFYHHLRAKTFEESANAFALAADADRVAFVDEPAIRSTVNAVFENLNATLTALLPEARIEHIGSTSIPGAITKGDLDICVQVEQSAFPEADRILSERFARNVGSHQSASLSSFVDNSRPVPVGVQLVALGGNEDFFLRWRDLLRSSPEILKQYDELKRRWHGRSNQEYRAAKSKFIEQMLQVPLAAG